MGDALHDRAVWRVTDPAGNASTLETFGGASWALRALLAAGAEGLPVDASGGEKLRARIEDLQQAGILVDSNEEDGGSRFVLRSTVQKNSGGAW